MEILILVVVTAGLGFDIWRMLEPSAFFGRPWPNVDRNQRPDLFRALLSMRVFGLIAALLTWAFYLAPKM